MTTFAPTPGEQDRRIPVAVFSGFLGSGKTTLINGLLGQPEMAGTAVIVNEFGEVGIDDAVIGAAGASTVLLESGCICCTLRNDLESTVRDLVIRSRNGEIPALKRLFIETTGLAHPGPIIQAFLANVWLLRFTRLDSIIATVDVICASRTLNDHKISAIQIALADRIVLTKLDLATIDDGTELIARIKSLNPAAPLLRADTAKLGLDLLLNAGLYDTRTREANPRRWLGEIIDSDTAREPVLEDGKRLETNLIRIGRSNSVSHLDGISTFSRVWDRPLDWKRVAASLDELLEGFGDQILRMKGILNITGVDRPIVLHGVGSKIHPPGTLADWPKDDTRNSRLVFITKGLDESVLDQRLKPIDSEVSV